MSLKSPSNRLYVIYSNMKQRCYNPNATQYQNYGGKGIAICQEWLDDFMNFYNWAMENGYAENLTLDRIDSNENYCPKNCRWITRSENSSKANREKYILPQNTTTKKLSINQKNSSSIKHDMNIEENPTIRELIKILEADGWIVNRIAGSHHVMKKGNQTEVIPVYGKEISTGISNKILKRIGLK